MLNKLIEKRTALLAEYDAIKAKLESEIEKRSTYTNEEREKINSLKISIDEIDAQIKTEKEMEEVRSKKLDLVSVSAPNIITNRSTSDVLTEFRNFVDKGQSGDKFVIPYNAIEKRATVTTSSNSHFSYTDQVPGVSINDSDLILGSLGVKTWYFDSGAQDFPSMTEIIGTFGTQDSQVSDQTLTSAKKTLTPTFVSASQEYSKVFLKMSKPENIQHVINELKYGVDKALEKRTIDSMIAIPTIASGATSVTTSFFNVALQMEKAINGTPSGYIFSQHGIARGKAAKKDAGSGEFAIQGGMLNGYPVKRSTLMLSGTTTGYLITASAVAQAYWGDGISVEYVTDSTLARKGNLLLVASALADGSFLDSNKIAVIRNVDKLT